MRILILWLALVSTASAQTYSSPTYQNLTVNGNLLAHSLVGGTLGVTGAATFSGGNINLTGAATSVNLIALAASTSTDSPNMNSVRIANHTGGSYLNPVTNGRFYTSVYPGVTNGEWSLAAIIDNSATGGGGLAAYLQANKRSTGLTWGLVTEATDYNNANSSTAGGISSQEVDITSSHLDDWTGGGLQGARTGIDLVVSQTGGTSAVAEIGYGYRVRVAAGGNSVHRTFSIIGEFNEAAFDASTGTAGSRGGVTAAAFRSAPGQIWDYSGNSTYYTWLNGTTLQYMTPGGTATSLSSDGSLGIAGNFTAPVVSGAIPRTYAAMFSDVANVKMFAPLGGAAICTGNATVDTAAFNAAFASLPALGGVVYAPSCGTAYHYQLSAGLSWANKPVLLKGDGISNTLIDCGMSAACVTISQNSVSNLTSVQDITFYATHASGPTAAGLLISNTAGANSTLPTEYVKNVEFIDDTASSASDKHYTFTTGLSMTGPGTSGASMTFQHWYPVLENVIRSCAPATSTGKPVAGEEGITVGSFIGLSLSGYISNGCDSAIYETDYAQGLYIHSAQSVGPNTGLSFGTYTQYVGQNLQWLVIDGASIFAAGSGPALTLVNVWQGAIEHTQLSTITGGVPVLSMLDSPSIQVHDNFILGAGWAAGNTGVAISSSAGYANSNNVHDNLIGLVQTTASLGSGTTYNTFHDNASGGASDPQLYTNAGTNNSISYVKNGVQMMSPHIGSAGTAPALTSCGTSPSMSSTATDTKGTLTEGTTATGCVATFHVAYATAPDCVISSPNGAPFTSYTTSTTAITIVNASASGNKYTYVCIQ